MSFKYIQNKYCTDVLSPTANIRLMYLICGYETASFETSPWCDLLDEEDLKVLEYLGDLKVRNWAFDCVFFLKFLGILRQNL